MRVSRCKRIVESLPEYNFIVVKYLICFLHMVRGYTAGLAASSDS